MKRLYRWVSVLVVALLIGMSMEPAAAQFYEEDDDDRDGSREGRSLSAPFRELASLVAELMAVTTDTNDTDGDGLPDSVEWVIGTDHLNNDTDLDRLNDYEEVNLTLDPRSIDSNRDGVVDCLEVEGEVLDLDGDGVDNAWDWDNDGDGVVDCIDLSPFARTGTQGSHSLSINSSGDPMYLNLQVRTNNPDNLRLVDQVWDWPDGDDEGQMQDLDGSKDDVVVTPMLVFETSATMGMREVADYGMFTDEEASYVPLIPVKDYGNTVAFNARIFVPDQGGPGVVTGDISLKWLVTGYSDTMVEGLEAPGDTYVSVNLTGVVAANATELGGSEGLDVSTSANGNKMLKGANGRYLRVGTGSLVAATAIETDSRCEFIFEEAVDGVVIRSSYNNRYLFVDDSDDGLYANKVAKADATVFKRTEPWVQPYATTLALYPEDCMLTGLRVEENHGTDMGTFYGGSIEDLTAANWALAFAFLRNGTNSISDMRTLLADEGIDVQSWNGSFEHRDLAVLATTGKGLRAILDDLPEDDVLPIINIMEDRSKVLMLSDLGGTSYVKGGTLSVDLGVEDVVASRALKTNWYNTGNDTDVGIDEIMEELNGYGLSGDALVNMAVLVMAWNNGEQTIVRVGDEIVAPAVSDINETVDRAANIASIGLTFLSETTNAIKMTIRYGDTLKHFKKIKALSEWGKNAEGFVLSNAQYKLIHKTVKEIKHVKWASRVSDALDFLGYLGDIGIAIFTFVVMAWESGWSQVGIVSAFLTSTMLFSYGVMVGWIAGMLGMWGPYGWALAAAFVILVALSELISWLVGGDSWAEELVNRMVEWLTDQVKRSFVTCDVLHESLVIDDRDGNGLDVGDRVQYNVDIKTKVAAKSYAKPGSLRYRGPDRADRDDSYLIVTSYVYENGEKIPRGNNGSTVVHDDITYGDHERYWTYTTYDLEPYFEPTTPAVNYQFNVVMGFEYQIVYWNCFAFVLWWCDRETHSDSFDRDWITLYFDVMPATIDQFAGWTEITSNDRDGDGLNSTEEDLSDPWLWDTDGDGLGDSYELTIGTDPRDADTDGDGLGDLLEVQLGTDYRNIDTDGDGLDDGMEYRGWVVSIGYTGEEFFWHVASDPRVNDTDGDGVSDYLEYWCLLNPMSQDTDGDGQFDRAQDYWISEFSYQTTLEDANEDSTIKVEMDDDGYYYLFYYEGPLYNPLDQGIHVYNPNGTLNMTWSIPTDITVIDFDVGSDGHLYFLLNGGLTHFPGYIRKYTWNGTLLETLYLGEYGTYKAIAVDTDNGHLYLGGGPASRSVLQLNMTGNITDSFTIRDRAWVLDLGMDGFIYAVIGFRGEGPPTDAIAKIDPVSGTVHTFGSTGNVNGTFDKPTDVGVDSNGYILVADHLNDRVQKFDHRGRYVGKFNFTGIGDGNLVGPNSLCIDDEDNIYVLESRNDLIHKYEQSYKKIQVEQDQEFTDTDKDMLVDVLEEAGWNITVTDLTGTRNYIVTSDPLLYDTDGDGLSDKAEYDLGTDPNMTDTDGDGKSDYEEAGPPGMSMCGIGNDRGIGSRTGTGTDPLDWDSDDDGLGDGVEITFKSDPKRSDSDGDGLLDLNEFGLGADPNSGDTDHDGLDDLAEWEFGSGLLTADADGDMLFDGMELQLGTDPNSNDTDGDGLIEGLELIHGADPGDGDTDDDGLPDGFEVANLMNASSADTDGDNVPDGEEIARGLDPRSRDSDGDLIPDDLDVDYQLELDGDIVLVMDPDLPAGDLVAVLSGATDMVLATPDELVEQHDAAPYVVLVGDPGDENDTVGTLIGELLEGSGELLNAMLSGDEHMAVRYGVWSPTQTVVMLSAVEGYDALRTLSLLKSMRMTVTQDSVRSEYVNPRSCFMQDFVETVVSTDSSVWIKLTDMATFNVTITRYDEDSTPVALGVDNGLEPGERAVGRYLEVEVSEEIWSETVDLIAGGELTVYYTVKDLDRTGDGDADDPEDLDETTLALYWYDEDTGNWSKLSDALDWVNATELDTADLSVYGREYAGSLWAEVHHLSLFGIGGRDRVVPVDVVARAGEDVEALVDEEVTLDGTLSSGNGPILDHTWTFEHDGGTVTMHGAVTILIFTEPGTYTVTLTVVDSLGLTASDTMNVTVDWTLQVGPVIDGKGRVLEDVAVNLTVGDVTYTVTTGPDGVVTFRLPASALGKEVTVRLEKEGYETVTHGTTVTSIGVLEQAPPSMKRVSEPEDEGIPTWMLAAIVIAIALVLLIAIIATRGRPPPASEDVEEETDGKQDPEVGPTDEEERTGPEEDG